VLVHEGIHCIQWGDGRGYGDTEEQQEWVAYSWEKYILRRRLREESLSESQKNDIRRRLRTVCSMQRHYCNLAATQRARRADNARRGHERRSLIDSNIEYRSNYPVDHRLEIYDHGSSAIAGHLDTGFDVPTDFLVLQGAKGEDVLLVAGTDEALAQGGIALFHDLDFDGIVEPSTRTEIAASSMALPLDLEHQGAGAALHVLDSGPGDEIRIFSVIDTDADGVPDTQLPDPFADDVRFPELAGACDLFTLDDGTLVASPLRNGMDIQNPAYFEFDLVDADQDGVADAVNPVDFFASIDPLEPVLLNDIQAGDAEVMIYGHPGAVISLVLTDEQGNDIREVGNGQAGPDGVGVASIGEPLSEGQFVKLVDLVHESTNGVSEPVMPVGPEIRAIDLTDAMVGDMVTIQGRNFGDDSSVLVNGVPAPVVSVQPHAISFLAPEILASDTLTSAVEVSSGGQLSSFVGLQMQTDCNRNGIPDAVDIALGNSEDADENGVPDECDCHSKDDVEALSVNGKTRFALVQSGAPLTFGIVLPEAGGHGKFVAQLHQGLPDVSTVTPLPARLGSSCFPFLIPPFGKANPVATWNRIGKEDKVGDSRYFGTPIPDPDRAPTLFLLSPDADPEHLVPGMSFTLQAVILNPAASSPKGASVTNTVSFTVTE